MLNSASSVGKSTIADFLNKKNYVKICIDDYWFNDYSKKQEVFNYIQKNIAKSNEYFSDRKEYSSGKDKFFSIARKIMYENGKR